MAVALDASMMLSWYFQDEEHRARHLLPVIGQDATIVLVDRLTAEGWRFTFPVVD